jgi:hypothetical protein
VLIAGVGATVAHALAFDDGTPCVRNQGTGGVFICPSGTVGATYSIVLQSGGGCGPALPYQYRVLSGGLPPGVSLSSSGTISGAPTTAGTYDFYLELSDENPPSAAWCAPATAQQPFRISINARVLVTTQSAPPGTVGAAYNLPLQAQMMSAPNQLGPPSSSLNWSVTQGQLPPGLSLNQATGVVSGTPTTEGSFLATYKAALVDGRSDTKSLEIVVRQPLKVAAAKPFATVPLPTLWEVGVPFSAKLTPSGGSGTYTFALAAGSLPTGLALGADGTVLGTPRAAGVYRATLRLADSEGRTTDYAANFGVAARLAVSTLALRPGKVGRLYRAKVASTGGILPRKWKVLKGPLPKGVRFDPALGILSGTPTKAGRYRVTFQVTDGLKVVAKKTLRIDIVDA